jgi:hypothetical protein
MSLARLRISYSRVRPILMRSAWLCLTHQYLTLRWHLLRFAENVDNVDNALSMDAASRTRDFDTAGREGSQHLAGVGRRRSD